MHSNLNKNINNSLRHIKQRPRQHSLDWANKRHFRNSNMGHPAPVHDPCVHIWLMGMPMRGFQRCADSTSLLDQRWPAVCRLLSIAAPSSSIWIFQQPLSRKCYEFKFALLLIKFFLTKIILEVLIFINN